MFPLLRQCKYNVNIIYIYIYIYILYIFIYNISKYEWIQLVKTHIFLNGFKP